MSNNSDNMVLKAGNIYLREVTLSDVTDTYLSWMNDPQVTQFLEVRFSPVSRENIQTFVKQMAADDINLFLAICLNADNTHIGNIKLGPIHPIHKFADIGILIGDKSCWGKGFGVEAISLVVDFAFESLNLNRVGAGFYQGHTASKRAFKKVGFQQEGIRRKMRMYEGAFVDQVYMGYLREEWLEKKHNTPFLPYGKQFIDDEDIQAVSDVLNSDWLTTGPSVEAFESAVCRFVGAGYAAAVSSGTAALHAAMNALDIKPGDEVIVPAITFAATANAVVYQGGTPVFADVDPSSLLIDPLSVKAKLTSKTRAVIAVDYAGHPCDYDALKAVLENRKDVVLVADACHALGAEYKDVRIGTLADMTIFSFHPVKHITTGEGGMVVTNDRNKTESIKKFRNHGISADLHQRERRGSWYYEIDELGYNYRMTDFQCALGISQLEKLPHWLEKRNRIADQYDRFFADIPAVSPLKKSGNIYHAYHIYVLKFDLGQLDKDRYQIFTELKNQSIGVNVHYIPVHLHPFYQQKFNTGIGMCPVAETAYEEILTIPLFPGMTNEDVQRVCHAVRNSLKV